MMQSLNLGRALKTSYLAAALSLATFGCSAVDDSTEPGGQLDVAEVGEELSAECTSAPSDRFVSITPDCQGCGPGEGRYVVSSSQLSGGNYASTAPCRPNYILQVGGTQKTFTFRGIWEDNVPTLDDVPEGGSIVNVCKALKLTVAGAYRGTDLPTRVSTGNWNGSRCVPPRVEFNFTHTVVTGDPGEFFSHARFLISGETAATKGKRFVVQLCRGLSSCG